MWLGLYFACMALTSAAYAHRQGVKNPGQSFEKHAVNTIIAGVFFWAVWLVLVPYWLGQARGRALHDASVQAALRAQEVAKLEEDARHEVALALVRGGERG